jgi:putative ABC transport system permease protein
MFSVVDAVVLRALPFEHAERIVAVGERQATSPGGDPLAVSGVAPQNYVDWAAQQDVFDSIAAIAFGTSTLRLPGGPPEDINVVRVTSEFFDVLGVRLSIGRPFTAANEVDGRDRVVILSDRLWRDRFGADAGIPGRTIPLADGNYEVIGVMPAHITYPFGAGSSDALWVPYVVPPTERIRQPGSKRASLQSIARLKAGISLVQAQAHMNQVAEALERAHPVWNKDSRVGVRPLLDHVVGANTRSWMLMLLGAVAIVMLIACANVANLLLTRGAAREREVTVRAALGAGRWRLVRQFMAESVLLAAGGTILALLVSWWGIGMLRSFMLDGVPRATTIALDLRVFLLAVGLSLLTALVCGTVPAIQFSKPNLSESLKEGAHAVGLSRRRRLLRNTFVVGEIALALVLLVASALLVGSFATLVRINPGFDPAGVLAVRITPYVGPANSAPHSSYAPVAAFDRILEELERQPNVVRVAAIFGGSPLSNSSSITSFRVPGRAIENDNGISVRLVTPDYHRTLEIPLKKGRLLDSSDRAGSMNVVVINEAAARKYFGADDPIGGTVILNSDTRVVVGVVGDVHQRSLEMQPREEAYAPVAQKLNANGGLVFWTSSGDLVVRTSGDPYAVLPAVKSAVLAVLPDVPVRAATTFDERFAGQVAERRRLMIVVGLFGALGLIIVAVGLYGVMSFMVTERRREIGVRMALGASRRRIVAMVLARVVFLMSAGLLTGGVAAWLLGSYARAFLFRLEPTDERAFLAAAFTLSLAALVAGLIPAKRAAKVDPLVALRAE